MMAFFLFLVVFVLSYNNGIARPLSDSLSIVTRNGLDHNFRLGDGTLLKVPTVIKLDNLIDIKGVLKNDDAAFTVVMHDDDDASEDCKFSLDFETDIITVTPAMTNGNDDPPTYDLKIKSRKDEKLHFSLKILARQNAAHGQELLGIFFSLVGEGNSPQVVCNYKSVESIKSIELQQGVEKLTSLRFDYK